MISVWFVSLPGLQDDGNNTEEGELPERFVALADSIVKGVIESSLRAYQQLYYGCSDLYDELDERSHHDICKALDNLHISDDNAKTKVKYTSHAECKLLTIHVVIDVLFSVCNFIL